VYDCINKLYGIWTESLIGGAVIVVCVFVGWRAGYGRDSRLVRAVKWWLDHVVYYVVTSRSWLKRMLIIAANNSFICCCVVLIGCIDYVAWLGVVSVGFCLGIALHLMIAGRRAELDGEGMSEGEVEEDKSGVSHISIPSMLGMLLNLLEVPAIMLSAGLALAQGTLSSQLDLTDALSGFVCIVLPLLILAAGGESLWMGCDPNMPKMWPPEDKHT